MPKAGAFRAADLPRARDFEQFRAALDPARRDDLMFLHAPQLPAAQVPDGLRTGVNVFGPGRSPAMTGSFTAVYPMREIASVVLNDAGFVASSMTVMDRADRVFLGGIENLGDPRKLAGFDPHFRLDAAGALHLADDFRSHAQHLDLVALPVCGPGFPNYGHFLYDGLPAVFLLRRLLDDPRVRVVGQRLGPWQRDILAALDLERCYVEVQQPTVFAKLLATTMLSMHVSYPTPFVRPMFDFIRFRLGASAGPAERKVFLSRGGSRRQLRNRAAVEACLMRLGFEIVHPERLAFREQVALLSGCRMVVGESGAAMANLGFCPPGTRVLEIQPERFVEGWTRAMCFLLGHRWHVYFARVEDTQARGQDDFAFDVDIVDLEQAVREIDMPGSRMTRAPAEAGGGVVPPAPLPAAASGTIGGIAAFRFAETDDLAGFALSGRDERLRLFAALAPPAQLPLHDEATLPPELVAQHHQRKPPPDAAVYALTGCRLSAVGLLTRGEQFFHQQDCLPNYFLGWLDPRPHAVPADLLGSLDDGAAEVLRIDQPVACALHPNIVWGHFLVEMLPRLFLLNVLARLGRPVPLAVPSDAPDYLKRFAVTYGSLGGLLWYDPKRQRIEAPAFVVPNMMQVDWTLSPMFNLMVSDVVARCGIAEDSVPEGPRRLYLSRSRITWTKRLVNEPEVEEVLQGLGFTVVHPETLPFPEQMRLFRGAEAIVGEYGSVLHNTLFARPGTRVVALNRHNWLQGEIARIRRQPLAYVAPSDGVWRDASKQGDARRFAVDAATLRRTVQAVLDAMAASRG